MKTATRTSLVVALAVMAACSRDRGPLTQPADPSAGLFLTPGVDTGLVGDTARFAAHFSGPDSTATLDSLAATLGALSWTVSDSRVAAIDQQAGASALLRAVHQGATTVTAAQGGYTASAVLVVAGGSSGIPATLEFTVQPRNTTAGAAFTVAVTIEDSSGHPVPSYTSAVWVDMYIGMPGVTNPVGGATATPVNGVATFSNLSSQKAGNQFTLLAESNSNGRLLRPAISAPFAVTPAAPMHLVFTTQPGTVWEAPPITPINPNVQVAIEDAFGNLVSDATNAVTIAIGTNPSAGALSGPATVNAVGGVATFANLGIDRPGIGYGLAATAPGLSAASSTPFTVAPPPGSIIKVSGDGQSGLMGCLLPAPLVVQVNDRNNQPVAGITVDGGFGVTGANGQASRYWGILTWGPYVQTLTASVTNVGSVTFVAYAQIHDSGCPPNFPSVPTIGLSPSTVSFIATHGGADPAPQTVSVINGGGGTLSGLAVGTITYVTDTLRPTPTPTGWLSASLDGTAAPATLTLNVATGTLTPGTYAAYVRVTSGAASNSPQSVSVTFTVQ